MAWSVRCDSVGVIHTLGRDDLFDRLVVVEHHVLDGVGAGLERHAVRARREAVHGRLFVERVRLVDDRVELFLRHVAHVRLFLVGAAAARGAGLDHVAAEPQVVARELAQLPRPVRRSESVALGRAREDQIEMRAGHVGEAADHDPRARPTRRRRSRRAPRTSPGSAAPAYFAGRGRAAW